jgi:type VI secretion system protein VasJ
VSEEAAPEQPGPEPSEEATSPPEQTLPEEEKDVPPKVSSAAAEAPTPKAPAKKIDLPPVSEENLETMDAGLKAILDIVKVLRELDPLAAIPYRLSRILKWEPVLKAPVAEANGKTKIPAPHRENLDLLKLQLGAGNWPALTKNAEHMFITGGVFYIDLQRYVHQGLLSQGAELAAEAVKTESGKFLNRLPELLDLTYASGMPLADPETRQWAEEAMKDASGSNNDNGGGMETDSDTLKEAKQAAVKNLAAALPKLQEAIGEATNTKNQMMIQLEVAKLFVDNRAYRWAMPILKNLYAKIDTVQLVEWDPEFCVDVWDLMLRGYNALPDTDAKAGTEEISRDEIGQKLFSVNVARAAALTPREIKK